MGQRGPGAKPTRAKSAQSWDNSQECTPKPWQKKGLSRAERVIRFIESLTITSGMHEGRAFKLRLWQKKIIKTWYATDRRGRLKVATGLLTMGRKNGKTALVAALALAHLVGPEQERRGQIVAGASDRDQSGIIFDELVAFIEDDPEYSVACNVKRHEKAIEHVPSGTKFKALSSDAKKSHGLSPSVVIIDELAQWGSGIGRALYDALTTAGGARKDPLTFIISTQSADDHALMSELVDYGKQVNEGIIHDPSFSAFIYEVPEDTEDPFDESIWKSANPALGDFRSLEDMRRLAGRAQRIPTLASTFKNLFLNMRVAADERWIPPELWNACEGCVAPDALVGARCYGGLDLGSVRDLTSFALYFPESGVLLSWSWCPKENIAKRIEEDRVPYDVWADEGLITLTPGKATDKRMVALHLAEICARFQPEEIAFDRFGIAELERVLNEEGIDLPLTKWGQGYVSMSPAAKAFEERVLNAHMKHGGHPLLRWAVQNIVLEQDAAGNIKPSKERSRERIDPAVAAVMAVGIAAQTQQPAESTTLTHGIVWA